MKIEKIDTIKEVVKIEEQKTQRYFQTKEKLNNKLNKTENNKSHNLVNFAFGNNKKNNTTKKLKLEVIKSKTYTKGKQFNITEKGLKHTKRKNDNDNMVYFGYETLQNLMKETIDIEIIPDDNEDIGQICVIYYNKDDNSYYIQDINSIKGVFVQIYNYITVDDSFMLLLGDIYVVVLFDNNKNNNNCITIKLLNGKEQIGEYTFNKNDVITIGSDIKCSIVVEHSVSLIHTKIQYINNHWTVFDGDGCNIKSNKGTWLQLRQNIDKFKIYNDMELLIESELFKCYLYY